MLDINRFLVGDIDAIQAYLADPTVQANVDAVNPVLVTVNINVDRSFESAGVAVKIGDECLDISECFAKAAKVIVGTTDGEGLGQGFTSNSVSGTNLILGLGGNDTINGWNGDDCLFGNDGDDLIRGSKGADKIFGGEGNDTILGGSGDDAAGELLDGGDGNDLIGQIGGGDTVLGGAGDDTFVGNDAALDGSNGTTDIDGGAGNDKIVIGELDNNGSITVKDFLHLSDFGPDNSIEEIDGNGDVGQGRLIGRTGNNPTSSQVWDFSDTILRNVTFANLGNWDDEVTVAKQHIGVTAYSGGSGSDTLKYSDALYDINTTLGQGYLNGTSTLAFTFTGFETITAI